MEIEELRSPTRPRNKYAVVARKGLDTFTIRGTYPTLERLEEGYKECKLEEQEQIQFLPVEFVDRQEDLCIVLYDLLFKHCNNQLGECEEIVGDLPPCPSEGDELV